MERRGKEDEDGGGQVAEFDGSDGGVNDICTFTLKLLREQRLAHYMGLYYMSLLP